MIRLREGAVGALICLALALPLSRPSPEGAGGVRPDRVEASDERPVRLPEGESLRRAGRYGDDAAEFIGSGSRSAPTGPSSEAAACSRSNAHAGDAASYTAR